jgi:hypothetical protein
MMLLHAFSVDAPVALAGRTNANHGASDRGTQGKALRLAPAIHKSQRANFSSCHCSLGIDASRPKLRETLNTTESLRLRTCYGLRTTRYRAIH